VFENRVLRGIFGPRRDEVMGDWRKLHNEELHNLYSSPNTIRMIKSRRMRWAGHVARMGATRNACRILVGKPFAGSKRNIGLILDPENRDFMFHFTARHYIPEGRTLH
jgi:hypothetical protein